MDMDFNRIFAAFSAVSAKQTLSESEKKDKSCDDTDKKEVAKKKEVDEGKKPDFLDMDKDGDKKETMKKAVADKKKGVKESTLAELIARMDAIIESTEQVDEEDVDEGNEFSGELAKAKAAGKDEFEVGGKKYQVKEGFPTVADAKARADKEKTTDKFDKKELSTGTQYTRKSSTFDDGGKDKDQKKAEKKSVKESDCGMMGSMGGETDSGMSLNTSIDTRTGRKTVSISADGESADQLMQMLKLAGMGGMGGNTGDVDGDGDHDMADHAQEMGNGGEVKVVSVPLAHAEGGYKPNKEVDETYSNEPNPQTQGVETQLRQGNDMHKEKTMHKHSYNQGDNPMAMREADDLARLEAELFEQLDSIKVKKPTAKYGNAFKKQTAVKKVK